MGRRTPGVPDLAGAVRALRRRTLAAFARRQAVKKDSLAMAAGEKRAGCGDCHSRGTPSAQEDVDGDLLIHVTKSMPGRRIRPDRPAVDLRTALLDEARIERGQTDEARRALPPRGTVMRASLGRLLHVQRQSPLRVKAAQK
jgi:hypothetical protein